MTTKSPRGFRYVWAYKKRVADRFAFRRKGGKLRTWKGRLGASTRQTRNLGVGKLSPTESRKPYAQGRPTKTA